MEMVAAKQNLGERGYAGQYNQRPYADGGSIYKASWWAGQNRFLLAKESGQVVGRWLSWDTALKDGEQNDASAMVVLELLPEYRLRLWHAQWGKYSFPQLAQVVLDEAGRWNYDRKLRGVIIEDKASGISALQTLEQSAPAEIADKLIAFQPGQQSKAARARQASLWCERGCVLLPEPNESVPWLYDFEESLLKFPAARMNDPADAFTQAILYLENILAEGWRANLGGIKKH
jgi:predicted phage terminase large subunit-like protein